jgi:hypothetical protein
MNSTRIAIRLAKGTSRTALAVACLLGSTLLAQSTPAPNGLGAVPAAAPADKSEKKRIETETVTITRGGAVPSEITRKAEPFFLRIIMPLPDLQLSVNLVSPGALPDPSKLRGAVDLLSLQKKRRSAGVIDLPPGEYHLQSTATGQTLFMLKLQ